MIKKYYYQWGDEQKGYVTTWELINGEICNIKEEPIETTKNLEYNCPFN